MAAKFDNLEDVQTKFLNSICYYDNVPYQVKTVDLSVITPGDFTLVLYSIGGGKKVMVETELSNKLFRYRDYNIGYVNDGANAVWWFRKPLKQYTQGLRSNQLGVKVAHQVYGQEINFGLSKPYLDMLTNTYPSLEVCQSNLKEGQKKVIAFHRDFALTWDAIHEDYILHYRAAPVGKTVDCRDFSLVKEAKHLNEALKEALG